MTIPTAAPAEFVVDEKLEAELRRIASDPQYVTQGTYAYLFAALDDARARLERAQEMAVQARIAEGEMRLVLESTEHQLTALRTEHAALVAERDAARADLAAFVPILKPVQAALGALPADHPEAEWHTWLTALPAWTRAKGMWAEMLAQRDQATAGLDTARECSTCYGTPHPSGLVCICDGKNTRDAEVDGLRLAAIEAEQHAARAEGEVAVSADQLGAETLNKWALINAVRKERWAHGEREHTDARAAMYDLVERLALTASHAAPGGETPKVCAYCQGRRWFPDLHGDGGVNCPMCCAPETPSPSGGGER